jgi:hypothetical protein
MFSLFAAFQKPLLDTTIEVLCQNVGRTFHISTYVARKSRTCPLCGRETFVIDLKSGKGNVSVMYIGADQTPRKLDMIHREGGKEQGLAMYSADAGTFILVSQEAV